MAGAVTLQFDITTGTTGPLNPAKVDLSFQPPIVGMSTETLVARAVAYLSLCGEATMAGGATINGCRVFTRPGRTFYDIAFPQTEYDVLLANSTPRVIAPFTGWSTVDISHSAFLPSGRGDSICVNTRSTSGGRHGAGRHFLPYTAKDAVDGNGLIGGATRTFVETAYRVYFLGITDAAFTTAPLEAVAPVVWSPTTSLEHAISTVSVSQIPSRLRSRTK
jgi:hypothetical protein